MSVKPSNSANFDSTNFGSTAVSDSSALENVCRDIRKNSTGVLGLDTEFIRRQRYYPILCTLQVSYRRKNGEEVTAFIVDMLQKNLDLKPLLQLLKSPRYEKIFHSCGQDLEAIQYSLNCSVKNYDDTQLMVEFCSDENNISYANALRRFLKIDFRKSKKLQISNWRRRPLAQEQIDYALEDVRHIIALKEVLHKKLEKYGNYNFYRNELKQQEKFRTPKYLIKNSWKRIRLLLHGRPLEDALLMKELARWRERKMLENNLSRHSVLGDRSLKQLAITKPTTLEAYRILYGKNRELLNLNRIYRGEIISLIARYVDNWERSANNLKQTSKMGKQNGVRNGICMRNKRSEVKDNRIDEDDGTLNTFINQKKCDKLATRQIYYHTNGKDFEQINLLNKIYRRVLQVAKIHHINPSRLLNRIDIIALIEGYEKKRDILYGWKYDLLADVIGEYLGKDRKN